MSITPSKKFGFSWSNAKTLYISKEWYETRQSQYGKLQTEFKSTKRESQAHIQELHACVEDSKL